MGDSLQPSICSKAVTACFHEPLSTASHLVNDPLYLYESAHTWSQRAPAHNRRQAGPLTSPPVPDSETTEPKVTLQISALRQEPDTGTRLFPCQFHFTPTVLLFANVNKRPQYLSKLPAESVSGRT